MVKKSERTDEEMMQEEFERERLERARNQMLITSLASRTTSVQATYGHVARKLEKLKSEGRNNRGMNDHGQVE